MLEHANDSNQHNPDVTTATDQYKKSTSPFSKSLWSDTTNQSEALNTSSTTAVDTALQHNENTNPNIHGSTDNERLLLLQRFATNNYCSSDESEDSYDNNKQN